MSSLRQCAGKHPSMALALALGIWVFAGSSAKADVDGTEVGSGFQGFGLSYHLGYGYGGNALGMTDNGGYPFYGGPGYPHPWPRLRRCGGITPFPYFGGPGYPSPEPIHRKSPLSRVVLRPLLGSGCGHGIIGRGKLLPVLPNRHARSHHLSRDR